MSSRFARTLVIALLALAVTPLGAAVFLLDQVMAAADRVAVGEAALRHDAVERARVAYASLFAARKTGLVKAADRLTRAVGPVDDEARRTLLQAELRSDQALQSVRISQDGHTVLDRASNRAYPESEWRKLELRQPLPRGAVLTLTYVTPRAAFTEFADLGELQSGERGLDLLRARLGAIYRRVFLAAFMLVVVGATAVGLWLAQRVSRRVTALAEATRAVGSGDLGVRVRVEPSWGRDELTDLAHAFNQMMVELTASRERIEYLQKISAWQQVARRLAHEIKNPLTPIQLAVQQLVVRHREVDSTRYGQLLEEASQIIGEEIDALRRLVEEFSAFGKLPAVQAAPVDAAGLLQDLVRSYAAFDGKVAVRVASAQVNADRMLIKRALYNLVLNAFEAGAEQVTLTVDPRGAEVALVVEDDGPGVPPTLLGCLFDPYVTTKEHGTGLGLAIVKKIALEHGGRVRVCPRERGARFELILPAAWATR